VRWVQPRDLAARQGRLYLGPGDAVGGELAAADRYAAGAVRGLGLRLGLACYTDAQSCCHVYAPPSLEDAEVAFVRPGLTLFVPRFPERAYLAHGRLAARWPPPSAPPERALIARLFA
jgi:hypothetical protein